MTRQTLATTKRSQLSQVGTDRLAYWLENYDPEASLELVEGFQAGFRVHFQGKIKETVYKNLPSALALPDIVSSTIHSLLKEGKVAGLFDSVPLDNYVASPLGLVPKQSVNDGILAYYSKLTYEDLDHALAIIAKIGQGAYMAK